MRRTRGRVEEEQIPVASVSPERPDVGYVPERLQQEAFSLIDVYLQSGSWKARCECGEAPSVFAQEHAAWQWITDHKCPVLESDFRTA